MDGRRTRIAVEIALTVALAAVLSLLPMPRLPQGGSIALNMIPLVVIALRRGIGPGVVAGALYGLVDFLFNPYIVHWIQPLVDYPIAYGLVGISGMFSHRVTLALDRAQRSAFALWLTLGTFIGAAGRFGAHFVSGVVFFGAYAPEGQPVWLYSAIYNATYILPSAIVTFVAALVILPILHRAVPDRTRDGAR